MKRFLITLTLLLFAGVSAQAQTLEPVSVSKLRCWNQAGGASVQGGWGATTPVGIGPNKWQVEFRLKSQTDKQIAVIHWSFRFVNKSQKDVIQDFITKKNIKPGKELTMLETFDYDSKNMPSEMKGVIIIRRVEYEDGSVWKLEDCDKEDS